MSFFSTNSRLYHVLNRIGEGIFLSMLWIVFSFPIITAGAASCALYYCAVKNLRKEEGSIWKDFLHAFRRDLVQGVAVMLLSFALVFIVYLLGRSANVLLGVERATIYFVWMILGLLGIGWLSLLISCIARFQSPLKNILKNTFVLAFMNLPKTLSISVMLCVVTVGFILLLPRSIGAILFLPSLTALAVSFLLEPIYQKYTEAQDNGE